MKLHPYLFLNGRCDEAIEFYRKALSAEVAMLVRFKDSPEPQQPGMIPPGAENKVMHARIDIGGNVVFLSDGHCSGSTNFEGFSLSVTVADEAEADRVFTALSDGGKVQMPLTKTFFSPRFGMAADKFGVGWMVYVGPQE